jgi:outer membrane protein assembly factor BamA
MRGYPYQSFVGNRGFHGNAELRFPLIDAALTPIGFFGPLRGTLFVNVGGAAYLDEPFQVFSSDLRISRVDGRLVDGFGLKDAVASWGFGLSMNFFGLPMHFDWSRLTDFASPVSNNITIRDETKFDFWIGFDF